MKQAVVGVSYGHHESSACLITEDIDVIYLREEWLSRVKNDYRFPTQSLDYIKNNFSSKYNISKVILFEKPLRNWLSIGTNKNLSPDNYLHKIRQFKDGDITFYKSIKKVFKKNNMALYLPHHLSHALTSVAFSYDKAKFNLHLVLDGYGDGLSGGAFEAKGFSIREIDKFYAANSLGLVYSAITEWAGFKPNEDEFKVMALSAYGNKTHIEKILNEILVFKDGYVEVNQKYFNFNDLGKPTITKKFNKLFGKENLITDNIHKNKNICNIICSFQAAIEKTVMLILASLLKKQKNKPNKIILSGGLFHNSKLVGFIENEVYKKYKIIAEASPSPGDSGSSLGAALFGAINENFKGLINFKQLPPFIGPKLPCIEQYNYLFKPISKNNITSTQLLKKLLDEDQIVATFNGYAEIGPRALGSRSLICNAKSNIALKKLNLILKKRESYRPIAPMMSLKVAKKIFSNTSLLSKSHRWMGKVIFSKKVFNLELKKKYPFFHKDGSARAQILTNSYNKFLSKPLVQLINRDYILANTSLNVSGDPMVFDIEDLYANLIRADVRYILQNNTIYTTDI